MFNPATLPVARPQVPFSNDWVRVDHYSVLASIETQRALSIWLQHNDTKPSQHTACLAAVFGTAVFKTVIDLRSYARNHTNFPAHRGVVYECATNAARIQNMCIEVFVDGRSCNQPMVEIERVLAKCPSLQSLTIEVFSEEKKHRDAAREQLLMFRQIGQGLLSELSKREGALVSIELGKYLADC